MCRRAFFTVPIALANAKAACLCSRLGRGEHAGRAGLREERSARSAHTVSQLRMRLALLR